MYSTIDATSVAGEYAHVIFFQTLFLHRRGGRVDLVQGAFPGGSGADPGLETAVQLLGDANREFLCTCAIVYAFLFVHREIDTELRL